MCAPFNTRSGYGDHARSIFYSIVDREDIDIKCIDVKWGNTPRNHLRPEVPRHKKLLDRIIKPETIQQQPDVYIDIRIPNEFATPGKFNIGITAGVETDVVSGEFIQGCNQMNLNIVPSTFTAATFHRCKYDQMQDMPDGSKQKTGQLSLQKPMTVLFEGVDTDVYTPMDKYQIKGDFIDEFNELVKEDFVYLHVGQLGKGGYGEDRKNITLMVKCFLQAFSNHPNPPAMVLKTNGANFSVLDQHDTLKRLRKQASKFSSVDSLPSVYLIHGDLTVEEMAKLYNHPKVKVHISLTHGEGFGRPLLESTLSEKPVIAPDWSGHTDFLKKPNAILLDGQLVDVPKEPFPEQFYVDGMKWFTVNYQKASLTMKELYKNYRKYTLPAKKLAIFNKSNFSLNAMTKKLGTILDKYVPEFAEEVKLELPKLKKVEGTKPPEIKLPKLQKV